MFFRKKKNGTGVSDLPAGKGPTKNKSNNLGSRLFRLFQGRVPDETLFEELEELLIESDLGGQVTLEIVKELKDTVRQNKLSSREEIMPALKEILFKSIKEVQFNPDKDNLNLFLILGVNGVGKTTSIAKLAYHFESRGYSEIVLGAGDTFRAAAIDQLKIHGKKTGFRVVSQDHGADPAAVLYDCIESAKSRNEQIILADTAGRMHNRSNLIKELQKIDTVIKTRLGDDNHYKKLLVIDATTGQNGLQQAEVFHDAVGIDGIIMTKYDSTAKGGLIVSICRKLGLPFAYLGKGETLKDLEVFNTEKYLDDLLSIS